MVSAMVPFSPSSQLSSVAASTSVGIVELMDICPSISDKACLWKSAGQRLAKKDAIFFAWEEFLASFLLPVRIKLIIDGSTDSSAASSLLLVSVICIKNNSFSAKDIISVPPSFALYM